MLSNIQYETEGKDAAPKCSDLACCRQCFDVTVCTLLRHTGFAIGTAAVSTGIDRGTTNNVAASHKDRRAAGIG